MPSSRVIRAVAAIEVLKGLIVLAAASGLLALVHRDVNEVAGLIIAHAHLNPAAKYPKIFLDAAAGVTDRRLWQLAAGAVAYSVLRLVEGYGLYKQRAWAEILAALSGAIYVPFELMELFRKPSMLAMLLLGLNLAIVAVMVHALRARRSAA
jgi:uncharacterized membrane protein (DUF2068 family)